MVFIVDPKSALVSRFVFEPLNSVVVETELVNAILTVEIFTRMWIEGVSFKYDVIFQRFLDEYSIFSENIPNREDKEAFREDFFKKHKSFGRRAKKLKRVKIKVNKDDLKAHVLTMEEEEAAKYDAKKEGDGSSLKRISDFWI